MWEGEDGQSGSGQDAWRGEWRWTCGVREGVGGWSGEWRWDGWRE